MKSMQKFAKPTTSNNQIFAKKRKKRKFFKNSFSIAVYYGNFFCLFVDLI